MKIDTLSLYQFLIRASSATYAGGGIYENTPERPGFAELVYQEGPWYYRDSYTGFYRSSGTEIIRYENRPVWTSGYGGGMVAGSEFLADQTFAFLKQAMLRKDPSFDSVRGPRSFKQLDWEYSYSQTGGITEFSGSETISHKGKTVFTHKTIGGLVIDKA